MPKKLAEILKRQDFYPGLVGLFTNPFYFTRKELLKNIRHFSDRMEGKILDVGCGIKPYLKLFKNSKEYIGLELDTPENRKSKNADYFYNGIEFPFGNQEFDSIVATEVLEHIFNPGQFLKEVNRIVSPNGHLLLTVPFIWEEHEKPFDFGRYSSFGIKKMIEEAGFNIVEQRKSVTGIKAVIQLFNVYLRGKLRKIKNRKVKLLFYIIFFGFFNILGLLLSLILPDYPDIFLDNVILAQKKRSI